MIRPLRTLASARLAWFTIAHTLAPGAVATTHARTVKDRKTGDLVTIQVTRAPRYAVRTGTIGAGSVFLKMWLRHVQRVQASPQLWSEVEVGDDGVPQLPPLYTSGRELAQKLRCTERSTRNYLRELKAVGFITKYQFRGREHAYCVWVNPALVWETPWKGATTSSSAAEEASPNSPNGKNFPPKELLETRETLKSEITGVDKLVTARGSTETGSPLTGSAGSPSDCEPATQASKSGAGAARRERHYQKAAASGQGAREAEKSRRVEAFWNSAKALIYKCRRFSAAEERQAMEAIRRGVFFDFVNGEPADWQRWHKPLEHRLELAAAWLQRNPDRYAPLPYAEALPGRGYFDAENPQGFASTEQWHRNQLRNKRLKGKQAALDRALDEAVAELDQRRRLDAGQPRVQASKRAKDLDYNRLHSWHFGNLRRLGGDDALYRFEVRLQAAHILTLPS